MANEINFDLDNSSPSSSIVGNFVNTSNFINCDTNIQEKLIQTARDDKKSDGGFLGAFFGTKISNACVHIGFMLCLLLMIILIADSYLSANINMDLVDKIIPVVTLYLGYIFGHSSKS